MAEIKIKTTDGNNAVTLAGPASGADVTLKLPTAAGSAGQYLKTDGSNGQLSFDTITPTRDRPFRNIIINGSMNVHQRGTTLTDAAGGFVVDRFGVFPSGTDEAPTIAWHFLWDNGSDVGPWEEGHRGCLQITNGNQTSKGATDNIRIIYKVEAYDMANSGWDYTDSNSKITLSFWVKSSVSQNFYGQLRTPDGTSQSYPFETGVLSADTWTKITKTIPGNSNLTIDHDTGAGFEINFWMYAGTDQTGSVTLNQWGAYSASTRTPDATSTWWDTNDCDLETTGWQLEVGDTATKFEFRPYGTELELCERYYQVRGGYGGLCASGSVAYLGGPLSPTMRGTPTIGSTAALQVNDNGVNATQSSESLSGADATKEGFFVNASNFSGLTSNRPCLMRVAGKLTFAAEI